MALPTNISFGTVIGRFVRAVADGTDAGRDPDGIPLSGLVIRFTPSNQIFKNLTDTLGPVTVVADPIVATTGLNGEVIGPDGLPGIRLVATDDPDLIPTNWTWQVSISGGNLPTVINFSMALPSNSTVDLTTVAPVPENPGQDIAAWLQAVILAEAARDQAAFYASQAEGVQDEALSTILADPTSLSGQQVGRQLDSTVGNVGNIPPKLPRTTIISRFQPGHVWSDAAGGWTNFTDLVAHGYRSWGFNSTATNNENHVSRYEFPTPVNIVGKSILVRAYIEDPTKLPTFTVSVDSGLTGNSNTVTYGPLSTRAVDGGKWWEFLFGYGQAFDQIGTPDRSAMRRIGIRMVTTGAMRVRINSVEFVDSVQALPAAFQKVVILESDDGDGTNNLMHNVMSEYGVRGTINMIAQNMDREARLSFDQLKAWQIQDGWDVQAHAYYLTTQNFLGLSEEDLDKELALLRAWCREHGFEGDFVIYPQGGFNDTVRKVAAKYYRGGRTVYPTALTMPGIRPYAMAAMSVRNTDTVAAAVAYADTASASGAPAHLVFHHWVEGDSPANDGIAWGTNQLRQLIEALRDKGYSFATYSDVYGKGR